MANFVNAKTSQPTSSTEKAYNKAKKDLDSNLAAAKARYAMPPCNPALLSHLGIISSCPL